MSDIVFEF